MTTLELFCLELRTLIEKYKEHPLSEEANSILENAYKQLEELAKKEASNVTICTKCGKKVDKCERVIEFEDFVMKSHFLCPECYKAMDKEVGIYEPTKEN